MVITINDTEKVLLLMFGLLMLLLWSNVATKLLERFIKIIGLDFMLANIIFLVILSIILFFILYYFNKSNIVEPL